MGFREGMALRVESREGGQGGGVSGLGAVGEARQGKGVGSCPGPVPFVDGGWCHACALFRGAVAVQIENSSVSVGYPKCDDTTVGRSGCATAGVAKCKMSVGAMERVLCRSHLVRGCQDEGDVQPVLDACKLLLRHGELLDAPFGHSAGRPKRRYVP